MSEWRRPAGSNADEWQLFLIEQYGINDCAHLAVQIAEAIDAAVRRGQREVVRSVFALREATEDEAEYILSNLPPQPYVEYAKGFARGRKIEVKGIARALDVTYPRGESEGT